MLRHLFVLLLAVSASAQDAPDAGPPSIVAVRACVWVVGAWELAGTAMPLGVPDYYFFFPRTHVRWDSAWKAVHRLSAGYAIIYKYRIPR